MAEQRRINAALDDALREMGRPTTPEDLARRGVRRVRSVGMREVSLLIERAVNRTLVERTLSVDPEEVERLVSAAQGEFSRQLKGLTDLADSRELVERHKSEWRKSLDELRKRVAERRGFLEHREPPDPRLERDLLARVEAGLGDAVDPARRAELARSLTAQFGEVLAGAIAERRSEHDRELSRIERRLEKLVASLEGAERALEQAASTRAADLGVESIYRSVQGLPAGERARELKSALMASIFEANLELRRSLGGDGPQAKGA